MAIIQKNFLTFINLIFIFINVIFTGFSIFSITRKDTELIKMKHDYEKKSIKLKMLHEASLRLSDIHKPSIIKIWIPYSEDYVIDLSDPHRNKFEIYLYDINNFYNTYKYLFNKKHQSNLEYLILDINDKQKQLVSFLKLPRSYKNDYDKSSYYEDFFKSISIFGETLTKNLSAELNNILDNNCT